MSDKPQPEPVKCSTCVDTGYSPLAFWKEPCGNCNGDSRRARPLTTGAAQ